MSQSIPELSCYLQQWIPFLDQFNLLKVVDRDLMEGTLQKCVFSGMEVDSVVFVTMNLGTDQAAVRRSFLMRDFTTL